MLRGSRLLKSWFNEAREPHDLDFVVINDHAMRSNDIEQLQRELLRKVRSNPTSYPGLTFPNGGATTENIWTYERAQGLRIIIPWTVDGLPDGTVQVDVVSNETLPESPKWQSLATADYGCVTLHAASKELSLAWKLLWLHTDGYPQGKDFYDSVILAEHCTPSRELVTRTFQTSGEGFWPSLLEQCARVYEETDWNNFLLEYPDVDSDFRNWVDRMSQALNRIFGDEQPSATQPNIPREWLTRDVVDLACAIQGRHSFGDLPILADALEEAGCDDLQMLAHCRAGGPHTQGCFVTQRLMEG